MIGNVGTAVVCTHPILKRIQRNPVAQLCRLAHDRGRRHRGRRDQPALGGAARRPGRVHRRGRNLARHRGADPRRDPRLDLPVRAGILRRRQRHPARPAHDSSGSMPPRLAMLGVIGGPLIFEVGDRGPVRRLRAGRPARPLVVEGAFELGVRDLPDRQGLQALADPRRRSLCRRGRRNLRPAGRRRGSDGSSADEALAAQ